ncbi:tripartite tricarboxylate transporter TctB family protein [Siccirubricoccus sp. G192]|uniref:tripartite tricarboxylate transporter TctB family protein n=1 Tax=Siccirubricoccus sp. G192 TaxID=2849651 RepID=UPI001C2C07DC|nr:tripartite tricarboxylate transporter TctB family protein [Siccirubricoccus sp. G192]MBV1798460.1 tripartite tricarboxylate transporter TctB family protein [Siccirubricoccus sp. G192]
MPAGTTPSLRQGRLWLGMIGLAFTAGYLALALQLPMGEREMPGAAAFPLLVGLILGALSLGLVVEAWRMRGSPPLDLPSRADARRMLAVLAALLFYILLVPWLGQMLTATLLTTLVARLLRGGSWWPALLAGVAVGLGSQWLFVGLFQVPLPRGELLPALGWH